MRLPHTAAEISTLKYRRRTNARDLRAEVETADQGSAIDQDAVAAGAAAGVANSNAIAAGCALNKIFGNVGNPPASPFTPVGGSCP